MSEPGDFELGPVPDGEPEGFEELPPRDSRGRTRLYGLIVVVLTVAAAIGAYFLLRPGAEEPIPPPLSTVAATPEPTPEPTPSPEPEPEPIIDLPPLDQSDAIVRQLAAGLSSRPTFVAWLVNDSLIRRFVVVVDNVAAGLSPASHLDFLAPKERFRVASGVHPYVVDVRSYQRYDQAATVFASLDAPGCAKLIGILQPLLAEAYRELGYPDADFGETLQRAVAHLQRTPVAEGEVALEPGVISYRLADPQLEALSDAQKHLLRMGPANIRKVQAKLREIAAALRTPAA
jgi:hypothetical protein